jgi:hypothetical protein
MKRKINSVKTKNISKILLSLGLVFVLGSTITQGHGDNPPTWPTPPPVTVTLHSTGDVIRGKTGSFVLNVNPPMPVGYVNFSVSGTAIPGVDYVALVSPAYIGGHPYGVILVKTLPDPRASALRLAYSVVVTLEPGPGYTIGEPSSAQMMIEPSNVPACCQ